MTLHTVVFLVVLYGMFRAVVRRRILLSFCCAIFVSCLIVFQSSTYRITNTNIDQSDVRVIEQNVIKEMSIDNPDPDAHLTSSYDKIQARSRVHVAELNVFRRNRDSWLNDRHICKNLSRMIVKEKSSPIGPLNLYSLNDGVAEAEINFDGRILYDQIWNDVSDAVFRVLAPNREIILLVIGIGNSGYIAMANKMNHRVIAVDTNRDRIEEACQTIDNDFTDAWVNLIYQNISSVDKMHGKADILKGDKEINLDEDEIDCDNTNNYIFRLETLQQFKSMARYTKVVLVFDILVQGTDSILICGEEFFHYYDVEAVIMTWPDILDKKKIFNFMIRFHMTPHHANGFKSPLNEQDFNFWPMYVLWVKKEVA